MREFAAMYICWLISMLAFRATWSYEVKKRDKRIAELENKYEN